MSAPTIQPPANGASVLAFVKVLFTWTVVGMCGWASVPLTIVSPFLPTPAYAKFAVGALGICCFLIASYSVWKTERVRAVSLQARVARQGRLEIDFVPSQRPFEEAKRGLYNNLTRTLSIRVHNAGGTSVGDCKLYFVSIEPNEGNRAGDIPMRSFTEVNLNPGDPAYVRLVSYNEPGPSVSGDTIGTLHVPTTRDPKETIERSISRDTDYVVTLRATGSGSAACTRSFRVWIKDQRLRMEPIDA